MPALALPTPCETPAQVVRAFRRLETLILDDRAHSAVFVSGPDEPMTFDGYLCHDPIERAIRQAGLETILSRGADDLTAECGDQEVTFAAAVAFMPDGELVPFDLPFTERQEMVAVTARRGRDTVVVSHRAVRWVGEYQGGPVRSSSVGRDQLPPDTPGALLVERYLVAGNRAERPSVILSERSAPTHQHYVCGSCDRRVDPLTGCGCS